MEEVAFTRNAMKGEIAGSRVVSKRGASNSKVATGTSGARHRRSPSLPLSEKAKKQPLRQTNSFSGRTTTWPSSANSASSARSSTSRPCIQLEDDDHRNVQVIIRARPVSDAERSQQGQSRCIRQENPHTVTWLGHPESRYTFDHVADESATQEAFFQVAGVPLVDNCMAGYNSCMFAYGQTGSGKTYTMMGEIGDSENRGMTPRVFEHLFARIRKEEEAPERKVKYKCRCSFLEIYNEQIWDLLEPSSSNLQMRREDGKKGVFVEGLVEVEVRTVQDVLQLLLLGATNRRVAVTHMNRESSRSHSVFTCVIESQWGCEPMVNIRFGRLNLVDLAGSERQKDTGVDEERLQEAASINKSLSTLGLVIMVLVDIAYGKQRHVPYRDSKLTFLLQDSLGGNSKTTIIANISPSICASLETLSTLKFAQRAKFIQNNAVVNEEGSRDMKGLQKQIQQLKGELALIRRQTNGIALPCPEVITHKIKAMEALLVGVLRREKVLVETSASEIEHLTLLVKQREEEACFPKFQEPCGAELAEWKRNQFCNNKLSVEHIRLQSRVCRCEEYEACGGRDAMVQDISTLRNKLLELLDTNVSMDSATSHIQVESCQRDLAECQLKLQTSLDSNMRLVSELDALRMELETSRDQCILHKQEIGALQVKTASEVEHWEQKQAQHEKVLIELKTQLQKSEERAQEEMARLMLVEVQLQEALQESTNLQTELKWTRDSLEEAEAMHRNEQQPILQDIGEDPEAAYEACMVGQMQAEIIEMHARLEQDRKHILDLQTQLDSQTQLNSNQQPQSFHKSTCSGNTKRKVRHQDAILQLQLELQDPSTTPDIHEPSPKPSLQDLNQTLAAENEHLKLELSKLQKDLVPFLKNDNTRIILDMEPSTKSSMEDLNKALATENEHLKLQLSNLVPFLKNDNTRIILLLKDQDDKDLLRTSLDALLVQIYQQTKSPNLHEAQMPSVMPRPKLGNKIVTTEDARHVTMFGQCKEFDVILACSGNNAQIVKDRSMDQNVGEYEMVKAIVIDLDSHDRLREVAEAEMEQEQSEEMAKVVAELHASERHVFKLKCQRVELRDSMHRQSVALGVLQERCQLLEAERANGCQAEMEAVQEREELQRRVQELTRKRAHLHQKLKHKNSAMEALEKRCQDMADQHKLRQQEKQVEVDILAKSVEELENTVIALETQVGHLKKESNHMGLAKEDLQHELQLLHHQNASRTDASRAPATKKSHVDSSGSSRRRSSWSFTNWAQVKMLSFRSFRLTKTPTMCAASDPHEPPCSLQRISCACHSMELQKGVSHSRHFENTTLKEKVLVAERKSLCSLKVEMTNIEI